MKILSIETSCDETAVSIIEASGGLESPLFKVLGNALFSQIQNHKEFGGVYPMLAKRKHGQNMPPMLAKALTEADMFNLHSTGYSEEIWEEVKIMLQKEEGVYDELRNLLRTTAKPDIDVICVTSGPGLAPALWVGISCAKALGKLWCVPVVGINHMEGHITSVLMQTEEFLISNSQFSNNVEFPALALLISGGHTELVEIKNWGEYKILGETRDDAVGEAFDKTARMLGLPYPGGPEISRLAEYARENNIPHTAKLPRPMIHSHDLDFSFSGIKTAVLYYIRDNFNVDVQHQPAMTRGLGIEENHENNSTKSDRADIAREFEDAIIEILLKKTEMAIEQIGAQTLIVAGGVIANKKLRTAFLQLETKFHGLTVKVPANSLSTDNALMIASAGYITTCRNPDILKSEQEIRAVGNLKLGQ